MANRMMRPVQLGFMSPARANRLLLEGFPQPTATASRIPQYMTPDGVVPPMAMTPSQLSAARAQQRSAARPIMPLEAAAMRGSMIPPGRRMAPPAPRPMKTIGDAFRQPLTSPTGQGLAAAALTGLDYAGPQLQPTSLGQGLARMGAAGLAAFNKAKQVEAASAMAKRKMDIDEERLRIDRIRALASASPNMTTLEKNLRAAGYTPGTPEYQEAVRAFLAKSTAPTVTVDVGAGSDEFKKAGIEYAFKRLAAEDKNITAMSTLENELDTIQNLIKGGAETGRISNALIPVQQLLAEAGLIGDDEMGDLSDKELLQRSIARIIPNMRVAGSGSTSDYEMRMFAMAAPTFARTSEGNRKIAAGMLQGIRYVKERRALMDEYMADKELGDGTIVGFDKWADEKQGKVFKSFVAGDPDAEEAFKQAYQDGKLKVGDLIFNGQTYLFVTEQDVEGF